MKKILIACICMLFITHQAFAATDSATLSQIEDLKERLATKVAELRQSQKKAIWGTIKAVSVSTITIETKTSDVKIELTDTIKVFQTIKGKRTTLSTDNLEKGDYVVVFGDYDTGLDLLKAKVIVIQHPLPVRISGTVSAIDKKGFTVSLVSDQEKTYVVDIEKTTVMFAFDKDNGVVKGGFSKTELGDTVLTVGSLVPKIENRLSATRLLNIDNISGATPTPIASPSANK